MTIDNLTLGEVKSLITMFAPTTTKANISDALIGKYTICRCYSAGVHAGAVVAVDGENVVLKDSRRLWNWKANNGVALSGVAQTGIQSGCKVDVVNPLIYLTGVCEIIPCTEVAKETIDGKK